METDMLKEQVLKISVNLSLISTLFTEIEDVGHFDYAHVVYLDEPRLLLITGHLFHADGREEHLLKWKKEFKEFLKANKPESFWDTLFHLHIFPCGDFDKYRFGNVPIISDILRESRGFLLWHYQLENLFRLFYLDNDKAIKFRKAITAKENEAYELSKSLMVGRVSLYEIIKERMVFGFTMFPNMRGACNLYNSLFS